MSSVAAGLGGGSGEEELPTADFNVKGVPKHYLLNAVLTQEGMFALIVGLRRLVDEYETPECELLLEACLEQFTGDLPTPLGVPIDEDDQESATP